MNLRALLFLILGCSLLLGCTASSESREIEITFDGENCEARGPDLLSAGDLIVDLDKQTEGVVIIDVYRLDEGKTWSDMVSHFGLSSTFALPPEWVSGVSGRDVQGDKYDRKYTLEPGTYGIICLYMGSDTNGTWPAAPIEVRN